MLFISQKATLLARTHASLVRQLSEIAGQAAARYTSLNFTNRHRRQLCHLDCFQLVSTRHLRKCATLTAEIMKRVSQAPAATCAGTATRAPVTEFATPTPTGFYAAPARVIEYVAPAPVIEYIAPPSTATRFSLSHDTTGFVNPQFSFLAAEASASQVVGSFPSWTSLLRPGATKSIRSRLLLRKRVRQR